MKIVNWCNHLRTVKIRIYEIDTNDSINIENVRWAYVHSEHDSQITNNVVKNVFEPLDILVIDGRENGSYIEYRIQSDNFSRYT